MSCSGDETRPLISIVIPTYHREAFLSRLLDHLAIQLENSGKARRDDSAVEIIVVDNSPSGSAADVMPDRPDFMRYVWEKRPGVAHARNTGVATARGAYVLFIDDDEIPGPDWLDAFMERASLGDDASFGPIIPVFEQEPPTHLHKHLAKVFSRVFPEKKTGADITAWRAYLGTGNSMFRKDRLPSGAAPFNTLFGAGGEDVMLLRQLSELYGVTFKWCAEALVSEIVPVERMTYAYLARRRFRDGQLRCLVEASSLSLKGLSRVSFWMTVGAVQFILHGLAAIVLRPLDQSRSDVQVIHALGGLGKTMWWRAREAAQMLGASIKFTLYFVCAAGL